ncbi:MAG: acylphosphatase [Pirellulaceae bacterium]
MFSSSSPTERREVLFSGHVQGVGFRYATRHIAQGFEVTGYVRNQGDGRVQLVCEGTKSELDRFLAEVSDRLGHFVRSTAVATAPAKAHFSDFSIRF